MGSERPAAPRLCAARPSADDELRRRTLRRDGIAAPYVLDGPVNGAFSRAWVEQQLVPTLRPGDIVVMDDLGSHKSLAIRAAIRAAGAQLFYLPPYSPDLNPIEHTFAEIKHCMRMEQKRSVEDVWRTLRALLDTTNPTECANYIANAGCASVKQ